MPARFRDPHVIEEISAYISVDEDGVEGVLAFHEGDMWYPMIGADIARNESMRVWAYKIAAVTGVKICLVKFSNREVMEEIEP
jgi:hypothetical protein